MLVSAAFMLLASLASATPIARRDLTCAEDGSKCTFTGCWTEVSGMSWCTDSSKEFDPKDFLFDTEMDIHKRQTFIESIPDAVLWKVLGGEPQLVATDSEFHDGLRTKIATLAKLSGPTAREVRDVIKWQVEIGMVADKTSGVSTYQSGSGVNKQGLITFAHGLFSEDDARGGIGLIAHEMGHAIFDHGGYEKILRDKLKERGLDDQKVYGDLGGMVNEPFAGILAQRSSLYQDIDHPDENSEYWKRLVWSRDIGMNFEVGSFYYNWYHLTEKSVEALPQFIEIGVNDILKKFAEEYGLQNDAYLLAPA